MIYQGSQGSVNCYYKNRLIVSRPLSKTKTISYYKDECNKLMIEGLEKGWSLERMKREYFGFIKKYRYESVHMVKEPDSSDRDVIFIAFLMCHKLKCFPDDGNNGILIMCRYKDPQRSKRSQKELIQSL